jgi:hypothetical protein
VSGMTDGVDVQLYAVEPRLFDLREHILKIRL